MKKTTDTGTRGLLWALFATGLMLSLLVELFVPIHGTFEINDLFGFWAWYAFASCVVLILLTRGLGVIIRRPEDYYDR